MMISLASGHVPSPGHDPVADPRENDSLTVDELAFGLAEVLVAELSKRDARISALEAELMKPTAPDELDGRPLNIKRAAAQLGCSPETVRRRCAQGRLDAAKDGGIWRIKL